MKNTIDTRSRFVGFLVMLFIAACAWLGSPPKSQADTVIGQVKPRIVTLATNAALSSQAYLGTNATGTNNVVNGYTNGFAVLNIYGSYVQSHAITLVADVGNSNKFAQSSNITVTAYPCYDTTLTNFGQTPIFTWQAPTSAGVTSAGNTLAFNSAATNIPSAVWDGCTAIAFVISNTTLSNLTFNLLAGQTP